jgi:transposase
MKFSGHCVVVLSLLYHADCVRHFLDQYQVARAVQLLEDGQTHRAVANRFGVSPTPPSVIIRLWRRYQDEGIYTRRRGQGRHRMTTARQDRYFVTKACRNRVNSARGLHTEFQMATGIRLSSQTVRNRLHEHNLKSRRPAYRPNIDCSTQKSTVPVRPRPPRLDS